MGKARMEDGMRKFIASIATSKVGSQCDVEFEVDDDATEEQIEEAARDAAFEYIDWWWEEA